METEQSLLTFFRALGQKERLLIAGELVRGSLTVPELAQATGLKEMALLRHLAVLQESGLVSGDEASYWLDVGALEKLNRDIWSNLQPAEKKGNPDEDVLRRFVQEGRLVKFPSKESHRLMMLKWVADRFDPEETLTEREISDRLFEINEDYATLRRYLVDYGFMAREDGIYWRIDQS